MWEPSLEWIGGFFDADGSVGLSKRVRKDIPTYVPYLSIGQSDRGLLEAIRRKLGEGSIHLYRKRGEANDWGVELNRDHYVFRADNAKCIAIAQQLASVCYAKRDELLVVIRYYERYNNYTKGWARWNHLNGEYDKRLAEVIEAGERCRADLRLLRSNKDTVCATV